MRRQKAHADPNIAPYLEPLRTGDRRVGVAVQEPLPLCLGASSDLPAELRFDDGKCIGQGADRAWLTAHMVQRRLQMAADRQSSRSRRSGLVDGARRAVNIRSAAAHTGPLTPDPWRTAASARVRNCWKSGERSDIIWDPHPNGWTSWHTRACSSPQPPVASGQSGQGVRHPALARAQRRGNPDGRAYCMETGSPAFAGVAMTGKSDATENRHAFHPIAAPYP